MNKSASVSDLQELHSLIASAFKARINQDMLDDLPTDAATLGAAIKFLKDNNISADPADSDDLAELRETLKQQSELRKSKKANLFALASADLEVMKG